MKTNIKQYITIAAIAVTLTAGANSCGGGASSGLDMNAIVETSKGKVTVKDLVSAYENQNDPQKPNDPSKPIKVKKYDDDSEVDLTDTLYAELKDKWKALSATAVKVKDWKDGTSDVSLDKTLYEDLYAAAKAAREEGIKLRDEANKFFNVTAAEGAITTMQEFKNAIINGDLVGVLNKGKCSKTLATTFFSEIWTIPSLDKTPKSNRIFGLSSQEKNGTDCLKDLIGFIDTATTAFNAIK